MSELDSCVGYSGLTQLCAARCWRFACRRWHAMCGQIENDSRPRC